MIHPAAWLAWVAAVLVILSTTRNPWYVGLVLAIIAGVRLVVSRHNPSAAPVPLSVGRFGLIVVVFSAVFNALTVHFGELVLFALPEIIPFFGGVVTVEALVYGAVNGLVLTGLFAAFTVFNQAVTVREMIRLVPRAFFPVAVITSIAVTFVPVTLRHYHDIREAQAVRGHRLRGWRDWLPLVMPLLVGGLERALQLAEAMTARGFASEGPGEGGAGPDSRTRLAILLGLVLLLVGWLLRLVWGLSAVGLSLLLLGLGLVGGALWWIGRRSPRTSYRPPTWSVQAGLIVAGALVAALGFGLAWPGLDRASIFFYPYPQLTWPGFQPLLGVALAGLLAPVALRWPAVRPVDQAEPVPRGGT